MKVLTASRLQGLEEYYFSKKLEQIRQLEVNGHDVINLGIGSPDLPPHPKVIERLMSAASSDHNHSYQSYRGIPELRLAIASFMKSRLKVSLEEDSQVLPLIGSKEGIAHISLAFLNNDDEVLIPSLGYPTYTSVTKMVGAKPVYYPLRPKSHWDPDWQYLEALDTSRVKLLWLNYPHMPTGTKADERTFERFVDYAKERSILLCHDNPYNFLLNEQPKSIFNFDNEKEVSIELHSLSKSFNMAGWRVGWVCGNSDNINAILKIKSNMDSGMFKPIQLAACEALQLGDDWFQGLNAAYLERRDIVFEIFDELGCTYDQDQSGMFVWAQSPDTTGEAISDHVLEAFKIFITPGFIFGTEGEKYARISLCNKSEKLKEALLRLRS